MLLIKKKLFFTSLFSSYRIPIRVNPPKNSNILFFLNVDFEHFTTGFLCHFVINLFFSTSLTFEFWMPLQCQQPNRKKKIGSFFWGFHHCQLHLLMQGAYLQRHKARHHKPNQKHQRILALHCIWGRNVTVPTQI